ncbi:MAG: 6-aminohexanoate hydrolase [Candidatus Latescibacteria bacterium]|nr:6-aminohexanoate hydrolase [Candidatus Latescibacterota bacterium]
MAKAKTPLTNDNTALQPRTKFDGPALKLTFPGLRIGVAEYAEGPTGCTVFHFPEGVATAVDIRGGSVGAIETDYGWHHAICFAGGSLFGLEAAAGVRAELLARQDYAIDWGRLPLVSGAIIWDWGGRDNAVYPDKELGRAALGAAREGRFPLGPGGAGRSATVGGGAGLGRSEAAGQGAAFGQIGRTKVAVFTVVNALGAIVDNRGRVVRGNLDPKSGKRRHPGERLAEKAGKSGKGELEGRNTTLTLAVTNRRLDRRALEQWGKQVHSSMSQAIQPFHTQFDGDILYAASTNQVETKTVDEFDLGIMGAQLAWDAVLKAY